MQGTLPTFENSSRMRRSKGEWNLSALLFQQYQFFCQNTGLSEHKPNVMMENRFSDVIFINVDLFAQSHSSCNMDDICVY